MGSHYQTVQTGYIDNKENWGGQQGRFNELVRNKKVKETAN